MKANDLSNFTFRRSGSGCYNVTYVTGRGDHYDAAITYMSLIDNTLHAPLGEAVNNKASGLSLPPSWPPLSCKRRAVPALNVAR